MIRYTPHMMMLLLLLSAAGCSQPTPKPKTEVQNPPTQTKQLKVVATFLPVYWFTKAVTGDKAQVEILVPPGAEVHEYQATPRAVGAIASAGVLVKNGMGLEEFLEATVKNAGNSKLKEIDASKGIQAIEEISPVETPVGDAGEKKGKDEHSDHDHKHHEHEAGNPHVWLDPVLAKQQVENIRDGLIAADSENQATYKANAAAYIQQLEQLDSQFKQRLQKYPNCTFITFHDAFPYLAKRYSLKQVAVVKIPETSLSPQDVRKTVDTVKQYQVKALLGEPVTDNKLLQTLSQDLNLNLYPLNSLESGPPDPQHYFTAMQANLQTLESACR
ncbi:MAG: zinc ABC transporter substrate-binding protein [Oscillatoria sp. Prado101]|nr:zinc ABC transporter substrate-binding protein [Oscillatoria sp. Prado101]